MRRATRAAGFVAAMALVGSLVPVGVASASLNPYPSGATYTATLATGAKGHSWSGDLEITFTNSGADAMDTAYLRLWPNGLFGCGGGNGPAIQLSQMTGATDQGTCRVCDAAPWKLRSPHRSLPRRRRRSRCR